MTNVIDAKQVWFVGLALLLGGCGTHVPTADLSIVAAHDMAEQVDEATEDRPRTLDLTAGEPEVDLAWGMCAGTALAGTCAEKYFEPFAACFRPAGYFQCDGGYTGYTTAWDSGARYYASFSPPGEPPSSFVRYEMGLDSCLQVLSTPNGNSSVYCGLDDPGCRYAVVGDGGAVGGGPPPGRASFDGTVFTCPDGNQVSASVLYSCAALSTLLTVGMVCGP